MARCMLKTKGLPGYFWGEAVSTAVFILNRAPTRALDGQTPYEAWHGERPAVHFLRTFGCIAHVKITRPNLKKLDDRSQKTILVGYEPGSKAYRCYDPISRRVIISRDVVFDEAAQWSWSGEAGESSTDDEPFTVEHITQTTTTTTAPAATPSPSPAHASSPASAFPSTPHTPTAAAPHGGSPTPTISQAPPAVQLATPPTEVLDDNLDAEHDDVPLRFRTVDNILGDASVPGLAHRGHDDVLNIASVDEPASFREAEQEECWREAMRAEIKAIKENRTWELVELPARHRAIGLKWVYKIKHNKNGNVVQHKARLVAKGYVQQAGVDFDEVFAPVARLESVRTMLALAVHQRWEVHHMDVKSAFLNGDLKEEVYVAQPPGFVISGSENKVLRLRKALYGLRQAPRAWNAKLDDTLVTLGFQRSGAEYGIYTRSRADRRLIIGVYVDDLIITGASEDDIVTFKQEMKLKFQMSDLGLLSYYLGIEVNFSVGYLSRFMEDPRDDHLTGVKRVLRYVAGTRGYGLHYTRQEEEKPKLVGFSDADLAGDVDTRKSTSGIIYFLAGNPITWQSSKQKVVALSSCESEYIAASAAACQGVWLARLLADMIGGKHGAPELLVDNQSAIALSRNPVFHDRSKHIDLRYHFIRECVDEGRIVLSYTETEQQLADILTKALGRVRFQKLQDMIGVQVPGERAKD
jgi:hypothetical protein